MTVYTSYFAKYQQLVDAGILPVSIARFQPGWFKDMNRPVAIPDLAPDKSTLLGIRSGAINEVEYASQYLLKLNNFKPEQVMQVLESIAQQCKTDKIALCCYETPGKFCHRHILADWLNKAGYDIKEYKCI